MRTFPPSLPTDEPAARRIEPAVFAEAPVKIETEPVVLSDAEVDNEAPSAPPDKLMPWPCNDMEDFAEKEAEEEEERINFPPASTPSPV
jgi:hypothetical protein